MQLSPSFHSSKGSSLPLLLTVKTNPLLSIAVLSIFYTGINNCHESSLKSSALLDKLIPRTRPGSHQHFPLQDGARQPHIHAFLSESALSGQVCPHTSDPDRIRRSPGSQHPEAQLLANHAHLTRSQLSDWRESHSPAGKKPPHPVLEPALPVADMIELAFITESGGIR